jgi:hypothetical protein
MSDSLVFSQKFSLKTNRVVLFNEVLRKVARKDCDSVFDLVSLNSGKKSSSSEMVKSSKQFHKFEISATAQKNIRDRINWLYTLAKSRYIKSYSGREIFNFKINFITLTLPSQQVHNTAEITNSCLNQFLIEMSARVKMCNYVWRLEFQKNGNVHYHIVTDTYIDYQLVQKVWNRIINKLGYVDVYTKKFSSMNFEQYRQSQQYTDNSDFYVLQKRYIKGVSEKWRNPRSVDVVSCSSNKQIASYISKYFGNNDKNSVRGNFLDNEDNSKSLRLWFCSRSLSKLKSICDYCEAAPIDFFNYLRQQKEVLIKVVDYATIVFFDLVKLPNSVKGILYKTFRDYAFLVGYNSA